MLALATLYIIGHPPNQESQYLDSGPSVTRDGSRSPYFGVRCYYMKPPASKASGDATLTS